MFVCFVNSTMPRTYKRQAGARKYGSYSATTVAEAVRRIETEKMSIRRASVIFNIPRGTLHNRLKKRHVQKPGRPGIFSCEEERSIVMHIQTVSEWGYPFTTLDMRFVAKAVLDYKGRQEQRLKNNLPSSDWARDFLKRHKNDLKQRTCQNIKKVRAAISPEEINAYFDNLQTTLKDEDGADIKPNCIFNYDETNLTDDPGVRKCVFKRGLKYPERIHDGTKASISLMFCGSAAGDVLPPYVVYKADHISNLWTEGGLKDVRYNRSKSGWFDSVTFADWFEKTFLPHAKRLSKRVVLIGDNLASHFSERVITLARENNIAFVCLPKNSTHICQPLDVAFFRPLKQRWRIILDDWKAKKQTKSSSVTKDKFPGLLRDLSLAVCGENYEATGKLFSSNVVAGFRKCGIYPLNRKEVLSRLPGSNTEVTGTDIGTGNNTSAGDTGIGAGPAVSAAVLKVLKTMRYGPEGDAAPARKKRSKINVQPGCSISFEDCNNNSVAGTPGTGTSGTAESLSSACSGKRSKAAGKTKAKLSGSSVSKRTGTRISSCTGTESKGTGAGKQHPDVEPDVQPELKRSGKASRVVESSSDEDDTDTVCTSDRECDSGSSEDGEEIMPSDSDDDDAGVQPERVVKDTSIQIHHQECRLDRFMGAKSCVLFAFRLINEYQALCGW